MNDGHRNPLACAVFDGQTINMLLEPVAGESHGFLVNDALHRWLVRVSGTFEDIGSRSDD